MNLEELPGTGNPYAGNDSRDRPKYIMSLTAFDRKLQFSKLRVFCESNE